MTTIAVLGLGNMGLPMALNLLKAGHIVRGFDPVKAQVDALAGSGGMACGSAKEAVADADVVVTMLPAGEQVRSVYGADVFGTVPSGTLLIDCSTIDVDSAREVAAQATELGLEMIDAPVSGGVGGAEAGTLTFMVGGPDTAFERAKPFLEVMGKTIVHTGASGNGQAAKICNNMILGISMIAVSEGFAMAENLGLDTKKLFEIVFDVIRPVLGNDDLLPCAGAGRGGGIEPGFQTGVLRGNDA